MLQLKDIGRAYWMATEALDRPPTGKDELLPILKESFKNIDPTELFRSQIDGEEFVIHWGAEFRDVRGPSEKTPLLAYEKTGKDGKRWVLRSFRWTALVPDDKMEDQVFPEGIRNPFK